MSSYTTESKQVQSEGDKVKKKKKNKALKASE